MVIQGDRLDIIIFGASGYTGKIAVYEAVKLSKEKKFTWGIAGRNKSKLEDLLNLVSEKSGKDLNQVPIILADVNNEESLRDMAAKSRVIVNCVGPYIYYGESVVKSCLTSGAHHVDVSAESQYLELMQLKYHKEAVEKGLYIVGACGMDCIPMDLGIVFLKRQFEGDVNSAELYMDVWFDNRSMIGPVANIGTFESLLQIFANYKELHQIRSQLFPKRLPEFKPILKRRRVLHKRSGIGWCVPHLGTERSMIVRSQRYMFDNDRERPIQVQVYLVMRAFVAALLILFGGLILLLAKFQLGRKLMLKFPSFFTGGRISKNGPTEDSRKKLNYKTTIFGEGWNDKLAEPTDQHKTRPNKRVKVEVTCKDPGYTSTCIMLLLSAITILEEANKMPDRGGVYPPGAAFAKTSLIDELQQHGVKFEVTGK